MQRCLLILVMMLTSPAAADDRRAIAFAREAIHSLQNEYDRHLGKSDRRPYSSDRYEVEQDLIRAMLALCKLTGDSDEAVVQLQKNVKWFEDRNARLLKSLMRMSGHHQLQLLDARLQLADQANDGQLRAKLLEEALMVEEKTLARMVKIWKSVYGGDMYIAKQKLRIAHLVANGTICVTSDR